MKKSLIGVSNKHYFSAKIAKPLNMILDDGGDLTNMVFDRYPELVVMELTV